MSPGLMPEGGGKDDETGDYDQGGRCPGDKTNSAVALGQLRRVLLAEVNVQRV